MKRNILLAFLLVGLVVMEWGCMFLGGNCDPVPDDNYKIIGIDAVELRGYQNSNIKDTVRFDTLKFNFYLKTELITFSKKHLNLQNGAFATSCPPPSQVIINQFDSIKIKTLINGDIKDITYLFGIDAQTSYIDGKYIYSWISFIEKESLGYLNTIYNYRSPNLTLGIISSPGITIDSAITFQFFDTEGNIFETTTDPIIITP